MLVLKVVKDLDRERILGNLSYAGGVKKGC